MPSHVGAAAAMEIPHGDHEDDQGCLPPVSADIVHRVNTTESWKHFLRELLLLTRTLQSKTLALYHSEQNINIANARIV